MKVRISHRGCPSSCSFPDSQAATSGRVIMNEIVPILGDMGSECSGRPPPDAYPDFQSVLKPTGFSRWLFSLIHGLGFFDYFGASFLGFFASLFFRCCPFAMIVSLCDDNDIIN